MKHSAGMSVSPRSSLLRAAAALAALSGAVAVTAVGHALYLMLLLDVALPGRSDETLVGLLAMGLALVAVHATLAAARRRILADVAALSDRSIDDALGDALRTALTGGAAAAALDAASVPLLLVALACIGGPAALLPLVGLAAIAALLAAAWRPACNEREDAGQARATGGEASGTLLALLGVAATMRTAGQAQQQQVASAQRKAAARLAGVRSRAALVCGITLTATAAAAVAQMADDVASPGAFAAALVLTAFALRPFDALAARIDAAAAGFTAWRKMLPFKETPADPRIVALPRPSRTVEVADIAVPLPGTRRLILGGISFAAAAGDIVALVGPAEAGKSTLLKVLAGAVAGAAGTVRLDGAALDQWDAPARARHIGYLPSLPHLLPGTIAQNIARFDPFAASEAVIGAARAAGAHEAIVRLSDGYDTLVAPDCALALSVQQRIALARALYGDPFLLLLDHPGSYQDNAGLAALQHCLRGLRDRGAVTIVAGDSGAVIDVVNLALVLRAGAMVDFGPKDAVRARMAERQRREAERAAAIVVQADAPARAAAASPAEAAS